MRKVFPKPFVAFVAEGLLFGRMARSHGRVVCLVALDLLVLSGENICERSGHGRYSSSIDVLSATCGCPTSPILDRARAQTRRLSGAHFFVPGA